MLIKRYKRKRVYIRRVKVRMYKRDRYIRRIKVRMYKRELGGREYKGGIYIFYQTNLFILKVLYK